MKPVVIFAIVAVAMIGVMVPSSLAQLEIENLLDDRVVPIKQMCTNSKMTILDACDYRCGEPKINFRIIDEDGNNIKNGDFEKILHVDLDEYPEKSVIILSKNNFQDNELELCVFDSVNPTTVSSNDLVTDYTEKFMDKSEDMAVVITTNLGKMTIEFFPDFAPNHVENFIKLSESGFYEGTFFHRIIPGFMIQGGDPNTKTDNSAIWGTGGTSQKLDSEFNTIMHNRGIVSMARSQDPNSASSQFFIVHMDSNFLDQEYTVFGRLITEESFETLDKIANVRTGNNDVPTNKEDVKILEANVVSISDISDKLYLSPPKRIGEISSSDDSKKIIEKFEKQSTSEPKVYSYNQIYAISDQARYDCEVKYGPPFDSMNQQFAYNDCYNNVNTWELDQLDRTDYYGEPQIDASNGGGCLIATATYGSELAPQVQQLRELRDKQLLQTESGAAFMSAFNDIYYSFSPTIADYERENPYFKEAVKLAITPMISTLSLMENAESESEVLGIGISVIMLNLGMYLGVPAIVIVGIRKIR